MLHSRQRIYNRLHAILPKAKTLLCVDCGKQAFDYDHPKGYAGDNWNLVEPVCRPCHWKREKARDSYSRLRKRNKKHSHYKLRRFGPRLQNGSFFS